MKIYPLMQSQEGILMTCRQMPHSTCYNLPIAIPFPKEVEADRLYSAWCATVDSRKVLKTRLIETESGKVMQYADPRLVLEVQRRTMSEEELLDYIGKDFVRPFDLFGDQPLCRFELIETPEHNWLIADFHHIIADGITIAHIFLGKDLPNAYETGQLAEDNDAMYREAERETLSIDSPEYCEARRFYHELFEDIDFTTLPEKRRGDKDIDSSFAWVSKYLSRNEVDIWCKEHGVSINLLLMAAYCIVLAKLSHTRRVAFATLSHGRNTRSLRNAYGMFVRTVPFVADVNGDITLPDFLLSLRRSLTASVRHAEYPYTHFCHDLHKWAATTFAFQGENIMENVSIGKSTACGRQLHHEQAGQDLGCIIYTHPDDYEIRINANESHYYKEILQLFADSMSECLRWLMENPEGRIGDAEILSESARQEIVYYSQGEKTDYDAGKTLIDLFLKQVKKTPLNIAVSDGTTSLTYEKLDQKSDALADWLINHGTHQGDIVGIEATPHCHFLTTALAVMRIGAAYLPIDTTWPESFRNNIVNEACIQHILNPEHLPETLEDKPLSINQAKPSQTAYVIYTSGTTGSAKGVMVPNSALSNLVHFIVKRWRLDASSRISCHSSLSFDASVEDLFPVLTVGGTVYIMPEYVRHDPELLHQFIDSHAITGGCYTTQMGDILSSHQHPALQYICLGGEMMTSVPDMDCRIINTYGPTECCVDATYYELEHGHDYDTIPIGRPLDNMVAMVTDPYSKLLPRGAVGELLLSGPQLAYGYLHSPELTTELFAYSQEDGKTYYHTGDLVRWNDEWQLEYIGRKDNLVKIDGHRVNLNEVERQIATLTGISAVCVTLVEQGNRKSLCAYYESKDDEKVLVDKLRKRCPSYMLPTQWIRMERLPRRSNGKIDRSKMPRPFSTLLTTNVPFNPLQRIVCDAFSCVLGLKEISIDTDFFDNGGTSLTAMSLMAEMGKSSISVDYGWVFECPTPRQLAQRIATGGDISSLSIEGDYSKISQYLADVKWPETSSASHLPQDDILLTGATGYLGIHLLHDFLFHSAVHIYCLVRGYNEEEATNRLFDTYAYYFGNAPTSVLRERIHVIVGDLTHSDCHDTLMRHRYTYIINCAANVRHFAKAGLLKEVNTEAVSMLVDICQCTGARMIQLSTLSVAGFQSEKSTSSILSERDLYIGQQIADAYTHSKFMAERMVLEAAAVGQIDAMVIRVGSLSARSTDGLFQRNASENSLYNLISLCNRLACMPQSVAKINIDMSPVDIVSKGIMLLTAQKEHPVVAHVSSPKKCHLHELVATPKVIDDELFMKMASELPHEDNVLPMSLTVSAFSTLMQTGQPVMTDNKLTANLLHKLGIRWD